jgi:signal transduction histidine kinase
VVLNLVGNGVRASKGQAVPEVKLYGTVQGKFKITVTDNGPGFILKDSDLKKGVSGFESTGLGLQFCRNVLIEHNSSLVINRLDNFTTVSFELDLERGTQ